jgi:hypothetical protein
MDGNDNAMSYDTIILVRADGTQLNINDGTNYESSVAGLADIPQPEAVLSAGYATGSALVDSRDLPRTISVVIHIAAGSAVWPVRNAAFNAARDNLVKFVRRRGELVSLRVSIQGYTGNWQIDCISQGAPVSAGGNGEEAPDYTLSLLAPIPILYDPAIKQVTTTLDATHNPRTVTVTVAGTGGDVAGPNVETPPILAITPTAAKTTRWNYVRTYVVQNNANVELLRYAVAIPFDSAWHIANARMRSDGADLRVFANSAELSRWFGGAVATATQVWIELDIPAAGSVTVQFTYGTPGATYPGNATDGPEFALDHSSNTVWKYEGRFMDTPAHLSTRSFQWAAHVAAAIGLTPIRVHFSSPYPTPDAYSVNAAGAWILTTGNIQGYAGIALHHPLGITSIRHNGYTQTNTTLEKFVLRTRDPDTWIITDAWSQDTNTAGALTAYGWITTTPAAPVEAVVFALRSLSLHTEQAGMIGGAAYVELTINTPPTVTGAGSGTSNETQVYMLEMTITNLTTGQTIVLFGPITKIGSVWQTANVDLLNQVLDMAGAPFYFALTVPPPIRANWLELVPGTNVLQLTDVETAGLSVVIQWYNRRI